MSEQSERTERTMNEPVRHLTFAEAGERLNISADAVRMRVSRGKLAAVRVHDRTFVLWPQPEQPHEPNVERTRSERSERRSDDPDRDQLVDQLQSENAYLRQQLDHQTHIIAGLVQRLPELAATAEDAAVAHERAPVGDEKAKAAPNSVVDRLRRLIGRS